MSSTAENSFESTGLRLGPIVLKPGISALNVSTLYFGAFFGIGIMTAIGAVGQPYIFNEMLNIPMDEQGTLSGRLLLLNEIIVLLAVGPIGAISDKFGRKPLWAAGFLVIALGYFLYPLATSGSDLFLYRSIFAIGVATNSAMLAAICNDFPEDHCRGKMIASTFVFNGIGLVVLISIFRTLPAFFADNGYDPVWAGRLALWTITSICVFVACVVMLGMKSGAPAQLEKKDPVLATLKLGFSEAKNPRVALAYLGAMVSRGDMAVLSTFFTLWLTQEGLAQGMTTAEALKKAGLFYIVIQGATLPWAVIIGLFIDKIDRVLGLAMAMVIAGVGYGSFGLVEDPLSNKMFICAVIVGMGEVFANLSALSLIGSEAPERGRGAVIGTFSFFGAGGILMVGLVGGWLFDNWQPVGPFLFVAATNILVLFLAIGVLVKGGIKHSATRAEAADSA